jgi:hypothetical protein
MAARLGVQDIFAGMTMPIPTFLKNYIQPFCEGYVEFKELGQAELC